MADCNKAKRASVDKLKAAYNPIILELGIMITNMKRRKLDPTKYYDGNNDQIIDLVALVEDIGRERDSGISKMEDEVDKQCLSETEEFLQDMVDVAVAFYTNGLSLVIPRHMSHIDVKEILAGKPLGGDNSVFNQVRDSIFRGIGLGENNDLRRVIEDPVGGVADLGENIVEEGKRFLGKLGIHL